MTSTEATLLWMESKNLKPIPSRETLIYARGCMRREQLPEEILQFLATYFPWGRRGPPEIELVN
mgnify:CR=1 FL=1